ncbi:hypothetical protein [Pelagibius sp. Alg239-R121]|nr:hypothetical protein [Pelagibius sp. Alg239-R121]
MSLLPGKGCNAEAKRDILAKAVVEGQVIREIVVFAPANHHAMNLYAYHL